MAGISSFDETAWWGDCANTWHEEQKQIVYAKRMGLQPLWGVAHPPTFDLRGTSVIDIGGGPVSLLLKCEGLGRAAVADPGEWPQWVLDRYQTHGVEYWRMEGESESITGYSFDEAWIYNVLQHTSDPERVVSNARSIARIIRIFEWINIAPYEGHPHMLSQEALDEWLDGVGFVTRLDESGCVGTAYYGVFATHDRTIDCSCG